MQQKQIVTEQELIQNRIIGIIQREIWIDWTTMWSIPECVCEHTVIKTK